MDGLSGTIAGDVAGPVDQAAHHPEPEEWSFQVL